MQKLTTPVAVIISGILISASILLSTNSGTFNLNGANKASGGGPEGQQAAPQGANAAEIGRELGLGADFEKCVAERTFTKNIDDDLNDAVASGGQGTPHSVVIAANGEKFLLSGAQPYSEVKRAIDLALNAKGKTAGAVDVKVAAVTDQDHIRGDIKAPVKIIEFSDLECPFCGRFHPTMQQAFNEYQGKVAWIYRHFPLESIHPTARPLAEASECAASIGGNDKFWEFIDTAFARQ